MLQQNLVQIIAHSIHDHWDSPALTNYQAETLCYRDAALAIARLHGIYAACGLERGDKIAVCGKNCANWAITYLSAVTYGAVIVPILSEFHSDEIHHIVNHSNSRLLFASRFVCEQLDDGMMKNLQAIFLLDDLSLNLVTEPENRLDLERAVAGPEKSRGSTPKPSELGYAAVQNSELAAIVYTSGTTGFSKGVMLPHNSLMANVEFYFDNLVIHPGQTMLSFLPLAHAFGCAFEFLAPFCRGVHVTFLNRAPTPKVLLKALQDVKPRLILTVPLILEKIYKKRLRPVLSSPKIGMMRRVPLLKKLVNRKIRQQLMDVFGGNFYEIVIGGAAINREVEDFLLAIDFPFTCGYGMTECGPLISYTSHHAGRKPYSVGKPVKYLQVRIASDDPAQIVGEILVRGENVMEGYYRDPEATAATIDADGWLHTGDLGLIDADGVITITGRSKNMILSASGQNIYPEEIESRLNNLPYVQESLVMDHGGQLVGLVYPDLEAMDAAEVTEGQLPAIMEENRIQLNEMLPNFSKIVRLMLKPEEFEKTPSKKIKRRLYILLE